MFCFVLFCFLFFEIICQTLDRTHFATPRSGRPRCGTETTQAKTSLLMYDRLYEVTCVFINSFHRRYACENNRDTMNTLLSFHKLHVFSARSSMNDFHIRHTAMLAVSNISKLVSLIQTRRSKKALAANVQEALARVIYQSNNLRRCLHEHKLTPG